MNTVTEALAEGAGRPPADADAQLAASLLLATWTVALVQAHRAYAAGQDAAQARALFLSVVDRGSLGLATAMAGTPYA